MRAKGVNTGAIGRVTVDMPRHRKGQPRTVAPIDLAYYRGETAEDALAFAAAVNASHAAMVERERVRFAQPVERPAILTIQHYAGSATVDPYGHRGIDELAAKFTAARKGDTTYAAAVKAASPRVLVVAIDGICATCGTHADAHDPRGGGPVPVLYCPTAEGGQVVLRLTPHPVKLTNRFGRCAECDKPIRRMFGRLVHRAKVEKVARKARPVKASAPAMAPAIVALDGGKAPCPRCGRSDWRTAGGRAWHIVNNPECGKYRRPERHAYATITA